MHKVLTNFLSRPKLFADYTSPQLWADPHIAKQMLVNHLNPTSDRATRRLNTIETTVAWLDNTIGLNDRRICDLGCGPGIYAEQFHEHGAQVTGIDLSPSSISHARAAASESDRAITYIVGDYTKELLPSGMDIFTLIFCDYCVLSNQQRGNLLSQIRSNLNEGGRIVLDVYSIAEFNNFYEEASIEPRLMGGFWAKGDYIGLRKTFKYGAEKASLERFLIIQPDRHWEIFNWLQYFSLDTLEAELFTAGFKLEQVAGSLSGDLCREDGTLIAVIATPN